MLVLLTGRPGAKTLGKGNRYYRHLAAELAVGFLARIYVFEGGKRSPRTHGPRARMRQREVFRDKIISFG
jgi:hypothetical protein